MSELTLKWEKFGLSRGLHDMLGAGELVDVTIACQGEFLQAHKTVLAACSQQFRQIFLMNPCQHPVVFMQDVQLSHLQALMSFIYTGEATVNQRELPGFMHTAEALQISGLSNNGPSYSQDWESESSSSKRRRVHEPSSVSSDCLESSSITSPSLPPELICNNSNSEASTSQHSQIGRSNQSTHQNSPVRNNSAPIDVLDLDFPLIPKSEPQDVAMIRPVHTGQPPRRSSTVSNNSASSKAIEVVNIDLHHLPSPKPKPALPPEIISIVPNTAGGSGEVHHTYRRSALLDGKFFKVVKDTAEGVWAQCQICAPHYKVIKGSWETTSNFKTHLSRVHRDRLDSYEEYKRVWRYQPEKFQQLPTTTPATMS